VVVLANGGPAKAAAEAAARAVRDTGTRLAVVPTRSAVQALAAVAVHDPERRFDDDVVAMAEAAAATRFAEVTIAQEQSLTSVGICEAGDVLGLIDGEVVEIGHGLVSVALSLTDRLLGVGAELLTVVAGPDAPAGLGDLVRSHARSRAPLTEVVIYPAAGSAPPLLIGVE
jgi:dihydroxyacetone kinase-like predicted kinase